MNEKDSICKYKFPISKTIDGKIVALKVCEKKDYKIICDEDCKRCSEYKSRSVECPLVIDGIKKDEYVVNCENAGAVVKVRIGNENKEYIGILVGDIPVHNYIDFDESEKTLNISPITNAAIFVFQLNKMVLGTECEWEEIKSIEELKNLKFDNNEWYITMAKERIKSRMIEESFIGEEFTEAYIIVNSKEESLFLKFNETGFEWVDKNNLEAEITTNEKQVIFENENDAYGYAYNIANLNSADFAIERIIVRKN